MFSVFFRMETGLGPKDWDEQVADTAVDADPVSSLVGDITGKRRRKGYWYFLGYYVREDYSLLSFRTFSTTIPRAPGLPTGCLVHDISKCFHLTATSSQFSVLKSLFKLPPELLIQLCLNKSLNSNTGKRKNTNHHTPGHCEKREHSGTQ